jgi:hypothetical protein
MRKLSIALAAAALMVAPAFMIATPAAAKPLTAQADTITDVSAHRGWRHRHGWRHHRWHHRHHGWHRGHRYGWYGHRHRHFGHHYGWYRYGRW